MLTKTASAKSHYTEAEAAEALGIAVEDLRRLIQLHIVTEDEDSANVPMTLFQPSDLLLLRLLVQKQRFAGSH
jgi:predicted nuclease of predicted toxin-antitoxin system